MPNKINKVFLSPQEQTNDLSKDDDRGTVILGGNTKLSGESSSYGDGDKWLIENQKISSMRIMTGTAKNLWSQLKKFANQLPNAPYMMDSRDGGIVIHNHNFGQSTKLRYTYMGGNGELIKANFKTQKKTIPMDITASSKIDPETKKIDTSVKQNIEVPWKAYQTQSEEDRNQRFLNYKWRPNVEYDPAGKFTMEDVQKGIKRGNQLKKTTKKPTELQVQKDLNKRFKYEKEVASEVANNYKVTSNDIKNYFAQVRKQFDDYLADARKTGNVEPLLKASSMGKFMVKKKVTVKEWANPYDYAHQEGGSADFSKGSYSYGLSVMKNNPNIIVLDKLSPTGTQKYVGSNTNIGKNVDGQNTKVLAIVDKEIDVEIDGARVFASATPQQMSDIYADNDMVTSNLKQVVCNMVTVGRPEACSSQVVNLSNVSQQYNGGWYTKKVKHVFTQSGGYQCETEAIRKVNPVSISTIHSRIHTPTLYKDINQLAKDKVNKGVIDTSSEVKQAMKEYYKDNPGLENTNIGTVVTPTADGGIKLQIYPAKEKQTNISNVRREKRNQLKK